ncbi:nicotinate-nucleotide adenylyltransferase [Legionella impletisoli]|uniref:Probable nicotinate-nucleotide adenylyltransferase n=1 Tax=Legionella impletisoli TaxID=343510 RepID=A0A917N897_9GAMM|nr:nicotinate-nucleotide adenylyltransferase [Legionella impletisoli]GGI76879.1 putative nicotinate-nucleotide adenylyltransferase [Legionella impletisoli]
MKSILIYGGTFDPPHNGHLLTALTVQREFKFDKVYFIPCKSPVLKPESHATCSQRIDMLRLALSSYKEFRIDLREIKRDSPSYMVDTLKSLREELGSKIALTLLLGTDAFLQLPNWHKWRELIDYAHILVIQRSIKTEGQSDTLHHFVSNHLTSNKFNLRSKPAGLIYFYNAGLYDISSTDIRDYIKEGKPIKQYLPHAVYRYIKQHSLYQ